MRNISFLAWMLMISLMLFGVSSLMGCSSGEKPISSKALSSTPTLNAQANQDDFEFPSRPPQLSKGKKVFEQNCASCHGAGTRSYSKIKDIRPIDMYLMLSSGLNGHPAVKGIDREQRWQSIFYYRYISGEGQFNYDREGVIKAVYGANCAVCHGTKGYADGSLYSGHGPHGTTMAPVKGAFYPPPANFHVYAREYNRTNSQLEKFLYYGIYPSAMPAWKGKVDKAKGLVFDERLISDLAKYIRTFAYENDLPDEEQPKSRIPLKVDANLSPSPILAQAIEGVR